MTDAFIELDTQLAADPSRVFRAISTGDELLQWFPDAACTMERKLGGRIHMKWSGGHELETSFQTFEPDTTLSYGFYAGESEVIRFTLTPEPGGTRLQLSQNVMPGMSSEVVASISESWRGALDHLKRWVEEGVGQSG